MADGSGRRIAGADPGSSVGIGIVPDDDLCGFVDEDAAAVRAAVLERIKDVFECRARKALTYRTEDPTHLPSSNIEPEGSALQDGLRSIHDSLRLRLAIQIPI